MDCTVVWTMDKRIHEVSAWAETNGFAFDIADPDDELETPPLFLLNPLIRSFWNVVRGEWNGVPVEAFDLAVGRTTEAYGMSTCAVTGLMVNSPHLFVTHRSFSDRATDLIVFHVETESEAFNEEWEIRCSDRRFASAVVHQGMMDWLLELRETPPRTSFELNGPWLLAITEMLRPHEYGIVLDDLTNFLDKIPMFLRDLYPLPS